MRIAIVLDHIYLIEMKSKIKKIMRFEVDGELITAVDEDMISIADTNYFCLWLLAKQVVRLYCDGLTEAGSNFLIKAGIEIYPLDKIRGHPILQALLLKEENKE